MQKTSLESRHGDVYLLLNQIPTVRYGLCNWESAIGQSRGKVTFNGHFSLQVLLVRSIPANDISYSRHAYALRHGHVFDPSSPRHAQGGNY